MECLAFNKKIYSRNCVPGIVPGTWDSLVNKQTNISFLFSTENIQISGILGGFLLFGHKVVSGMLFIHLPTEGYRGCFQVLAIMNKTAINISGQVLLCTLSVFWIWAISIGM